MGASRVCRVSAIMLTFLAVCTESGICAETPLGSGTAIGSYEAAAFTPEEGWRLRANGTRGESRLEGNRLVLDFSKGATRIYLENSIPLMGHPRTFRWSIRGKGVPIRLFLRSGGAEWVWDVPSSTRDDRRVVAPVGDLSGWRTVGSTSEAVVGDRLDLYRIEFQPLKGVSSANLELGPLTIETEYDRAKPLFLSAMGISPEPGKVRFFLTARSLDEDQQTVAVSDSILDFSGSELDSGTVEMSLPPRGAPGQYSVEISVGKEPFAEAVFRLNPSEGSFEEVRAVAWERPMDVDQSFKDWISGLRIPRFPEGTDVRKEVGLISASYLCSRAEGYDGISWDECREKGVIPKDLSPDFSGRPMDVMDHPVYRSLATIRSILSEATDAAKISTRMNVEEIRFSTGKKRVTAVWSNIGTPALLIRCASTEVDLLDLMGVGREFIEGAGEAVVPLQERVPMLLISKGEAFAPFDVIASIPDRDAIKAGESVVIECAVPTSASNLVILSEPVLPEGWKVVRRSGGWAGDFLKRSMTVLTPPTEKPGAYYAGLVMKLGDSLIHVTARIAVVK